MLTEQNIQRVHEVREQYPNAHACVLPILWIVQEQEGFISEESMKYVAGLLEIPVGRILGVVSFYSMFHRTPPGKNHIEVCTNISCMLRGSEKILDHLEKRLGIKAGEMSEDHRWTLSETECLGACGNAPAMTIHGAYYENITIEKIDSIIESLQ